MKQQVEGYMSFAEIAEALGVTERKARNIYLIAMRKLRRQYAGKERAA